MSRQVTIKGTVVEMKMPDGMPASSHEGLYLRTEDGDELALIAGSIAVQIPVDSMHRQSRFQFEPYLNKEITVSGYLSAGAIFNAFIESAPTLEGTSEWIILPPEK